MKFIYNSPELDAQIKQIRQTIRLSMNGVASESMQDHGLNYKLNYGTSIPELRLMAGKYEKNHDLAQRLWQLRIRETMILATLLQPADSFTPELAREWLSDCQNSELMEQATMNLYRRLPFANTLSVECALSEKEFESTFGFMLALRVTDQLTENQITSLIQRAIDLSDTSNAHLLQSIAFFMAKLCRINEMTATEVQKAIAIFDESGSDSKAYIQQIVKQELIFLGLLADDF